MTLDGTYGRKLGSNRIITRWSNAEKASNSALTTRGGTSLALKPVYPRLQNAKISQLYSLKII